jgi:hypothetical protein
VSDICHWKSHGNGMCHMLDGSKGQCHEKNGQIKNKHMCRLWGPVGDHLSFQTARISNLHKILPKKKVNL